MPDTFSISLFSEQRPHGPHGLSFVDLSGWLQASSLTQAFLTFHFLKKAIILSNSKSFSMWFPQVECLFIFLHSLLCFPIVLWISMQGNILTQMTSMPPLIHHPWTSWSLKISISEMLPNHLILCPLETVRQHHWFHGHEFEQVLGNNGGQGRLGCCSTWGRK